MSTGIFIPNDKRCTWHTIPWLHSWNKLKFKFKFSVYWWHYKQQLELELQGPLPLLFMNQQCVGSLMSYGMFIYRYDGYYDLQVYMVLNGQKTRKSNHAFAAVIKKVALSSQLRIFSFPARTYYFSCIKKL